MRNGVLDYGERGEVRGGDDVGDVAVREDITRLKAEKSRFGDAGVRASKPDWMESVLD